jgi:hypothetical protein
MGWIAALLFFAVSMGIAYQLGQKRAQVLLAKTERLRRETRTGGVRLKRVRIRR